MPVQTHENQLLIVVKPFYEWIVDQSQVKGKLLAIEGITSVADLLPYITVNTGHAITAYLGNYYGLTTIKEVINHEQVKGIIEKVLSETGELLIKKHKFN